MGDPYTGKMTSLYWDGPQDAVLYSKDLTEPGLSNIGVIMIYQKCVNNEMYNCEVILAVFISEICFW